MQHPLLPAALVGILAIMVGLSVQKPLKDRQFVTPPHFPNKMLALEFIPDSTALHQFFGASAEERSGNMEAMRSALRRDNFFALSYTLFLMVFGIVCWSATRKAWYWLVLPLALLAGLSDFIENAQTLRMLDNIQSEDAPAFLGLDQEPFDGRTAVGRREFFMAVGLGGPYFGLAGLRSGDCRVPVFFLDRTF